MLFANTTPFSGFAVTDLDVAEHFYGTVLGMEVTRDGEMGFLQLVLPSGGIILVYPKDDHIPAGYTILNFPVDDIDTAVDTLIERGVNTKIYPDDEFPSDAKGIVRGWGPSIAWFKDPSGNVLAVLQEG